MVIETDFVDPKLSEIHKKISETDAKNLQLQAIMMHQNKEKEEIWSARTLRITESLAESLKMMTLNLVMAHADVKIGDFDVSNDQSDDYLIERLEDSEVPVLNKIRSEMRREDSGDIFYNDLAKSSYLKGFAITFSPTLIIFNKVTRQALLKPKKYLYLIPSPSGEFTDVEEKNLLSVPTSIDAILYEDPLFIFNRNNFIQLFRYEDAFDHFIIDSTQNLENIVNDVKSLIDYSKPDVRKYRRLASACAGYVERIVQKKVDLEPIAKDYDLQISFSNGKIDIQNSTINDVLKLLNGQAVKDAIFGDKYLAQEKIKVQ